MTLGSHRFADGPQRGSLEPAASTSFQWLSPSHLLDHEAQSWKRMCLRSHSWLLGELGFDADPKSGASKAPRGESALPPICSEVSLKQEKPQHGQS